MENDKYFQEVGKLKKFPEGWIFEKSSRRMEKNKFFQKDGKLENVPEG